MLYFPSTASAWQRTGWRGDQQLSNFLLGCFNTWSIRKLASLVTETSLYQNYSSKRNTLIIESVSSATSGNTDRIMLKFTLVTSALLTTA